MKQPEHSTRIFWGKIRRFFLVHFRKGHVRRHLLLRQGACRQCGVCCNFSFACPMLTKDKLCRIYGRFRPKACKLFPLDPKDINDVAVCGGSCGYRFGGRPGQDPSQDLARPRHLLK